MIITKLGHCCTLIEENDLRILTDPGTYSTAQDSLQNVDIMLITHEHADHFHIESIKRVLANNPKARIVTNSAVRNLLEKEKLSAILLEHGGNFEERGVMFEGLGNEHALMYRAIPPVQNTGYFIGGRFWYPGDTFTNPGKPVEILALPVAGPWMKLSEAIDYALTIKPKKCFPVHDGILKNPGLAHKLPEKILRENSISFNVLEIGKPMSF